MTVYVYMFMYIFMYMLFAGIYGILFDVPAVDFSFTADAPVDSGSSDGVLCRQEHGSFSERSRHHA